MVRRIFFARPGRLFPYGKGVSQDEEKHRVPSGYRRGHGGRRGGGDNGPPEQPPDREKADEPEHAQAGRGHGTGGGQRRLQHGLRRGTAKKSPE